MNQVVASDDFLTDTDNWEDLNLEEDKVFSSKEVPFLRQQKVVLRSGLTVDRTVVTEEERTFPYSRSMANLFTWALLVYGINDEQIDYIDYTLSVTSLKSTYEAIEDFQEGARGVFALKHNRKTVFTINFNRKSSEIPRWKPKINMDRRRWEDEG